tara:strand:- start:253 stop:588 length:336 start_codon:yes stop_codon:yes gene_type:complete
MSEVTLPVLQFNPKIGKNSNDLDAAKAYFIELLAFQSGVLDATVRNLNTDDTDDVLVFVEGLGPVSAGEPATLRAITFQEEFYERGSEIISVMLQKATQIIENTSKAAAGN